MYKFSIIIPVYNRPDEVEELLESLSNQTFKDFEIIIVEDGSKIDCIKIVENYKNKLDLKYFFKENSGPGQTRNYGAERASGNYFVFFDSDCIIPVNYFEIVNNFLNKNQLDSYGGPDAAHKSFTKVQKAINYSMTSFFTTGGIRGGKEKFDKFHPRSFNMGFTKEVFQKTTGFSKMRFGEDVDLSLRIIAEGFSTGLIKEAFVYHKRRTDFRKFFKQIFNSGIARINLSVKHKGSLKIMHFFPTVFSIGCILLLIISIFFPVVLILPGIYILMIFIDSLIKNKNISIAFLSIISSFTQLFAYGAGFLTAFWKQKILKKDEFQAFSKNFYK